MALPSYSNPPLVEVVVGVTFRSATSVTGGHLGVYWNGVRDRFPNIQQQDPINAQIERFGATKGEPTIGFEFGSFPGPRLWLIDDSDAELIQVQHNMFLRNWRRYHNPEITYPRFEDSILPSFNEDYTEFVDSMEKQSCGPLEVEQIEVTYINHIVGETRDQLKLASMFKFWSEDSSLPTLERINIESTKVLQDSENKPVGRLHIKVNSGLMEGSPAARLVLTARGFSNPMSDFIKIGHDEIVTTFDMVTTEGMHKIWGKHDG